MNALEKTEAKEFLIDIGEDKRPPILLVILISILGFFAYFTGTSFISSVGNNIGPFETIAMIIFVVAFFYFLRNKLLVQFHFTIKMLFIIVAVAIMSLPNLADRIDWGIIQLALLVYTALLVLIIFNVLIRFPVLMKYLMRFVVLGSLVTGIWIAYEGISSNAAIGTAGPFRNRVHVGIYMLTSFWLILLYFYWPGVSKIERVIALVAVAFVLYGVAVSGRRSVYLSLFIGIAFLALSFLVLRGSGRFQLPVSVLLAGGILFFFAQIGSQYVPQLDFFNQRIGLIDDRLELATGTEDDIESSDNFILLQRQGMFRAVADHPFLGIGWGAFYESPYSPTGHEMHSTPQRFLAELGITGFSLYLLYNAYLGLGSIRLFLRLRNTQYQLPALIFAVSIWSLAISWSYNRSVTERTYWILIILFISFDALVSAQLAKRPKSAKQRKPRRVGYYPHPEPRHAPPAMPIARD